MDFVDPGVSASAPIPTPPARRGRAAWVAALCTVGVAAGAFAGWKSQAPIYRAEGIIYIAPQLPSPQDPAGENFLPLFNGFVALQVQMLESGRVAQLALGAEPWRKSGEDAGPEAVAGFLARRHILHAPQTQHVQVQFDDLKPEIALAGVQALTDAYVRLITEERAADERLRFASSEVEVVSAKLKALGDQVIKITEGYGGVEGLEIRHRATVTQALAAEQDLDKLEDALREATKDGSQAAQVIALKEREETLRRRVLELHESSTSLGKTRVSVETLRSEAEDMRRRRDQLEALKGQLTAQLIGNGRISVRDAGMLPTVPLLDRRPAFAAMGGGLGGLIAVLMAWLLGRRSMRTP